MSLVGEIFDVTIRGDCFGPGAVDLWASYTGKDASRGWAKWSTSAEDCTSKVEDLGQDELRRLESIVNIFRYAVPLAALPEDPGLNEEFKECASTGSDGYASVRLVRSAVKVVHEVRLGATTVTQ